MIWWYCFFIHSYVQVAPPGLSEVLTMACGACAVENGMKLMFIAHQVCISVPLHHGFVSQFITIIKKDKLYIKKNPTAFIYLKRRMPNVFISQEMS